LVAVSVCAKTTVEPARSERPRAEAIMIFFIEGNVLYFVEFLTRLN
jgi:hypothetical protein